VAAAVGHEDATPSPRAPSPSAARIIDNAFFVLGLTPRASWPEVTRRAEALLAAIEAGDATALFYDTPLGQQPRTAGAVRVARARLRDPDARIQQEIWWEAPPRGRAPTTPACAWPQACAAWGWRAR
jgi:hypothetical protein